MRELLMKLEQEKKELNIKIQKLNKFRGTVEWNELSVNHKCLLDIQLNAMQTYLETLVSRIIDIKSNVDKIKSKKNDNAYENSIRVIIVKLDE